MDKTQKNNKCWLCSDRDKTINHIINECSKLAQYMNNPASVRESDTHKLLWDFDIQTDHLISVRRPDLIIIIIIIIK